MVAAGKEMAELVGEKNSEQGESKRQAGGETERVFVEEREGAEEFVEGEGFVPSIGDGELCAGDEAGAEGKEEQDASEDQDSSGGMAGDRDVGEAVRRSGRRIHDERRGWREIFWEWSGHEWSGTANGMNTPKYSTFRRVRARAEAQRTAHIWSD